MQTPSQTPGQKLAVYRVSGQQENNSRNQGTRVLYSPGSQGAPNYSTDRQALYSVSREQTTDVEIR